MHTTAPRQYFPGLDALRLYAAMSVLLIHIWSGSYSPDMAFLPVVGVFTLSGIDAVTLFFVLSGFLITTLLLKEQAATNTINMRRFYLRRARRILPLYVFVVAVTFAFHPVLWSLFWRDYDGVGIVSILTLSGHVGFAFGQIAFLTHLWSIGIEEWFYAAAPQLIKRMRVPLVAALVIGVRYVVITVTAPSTLLMLEPRDLSQWEYFLHFTRFDAMAIGALAAWMYHQRHPALRWVYRLELPTLVLMGINIVLPLDNTPLGAVYDTAFALVSASLILNVATNPNTRLKLEHPIIKLLGQRSYGIYMLHMFAIYFVSPVFAYSAALFVIVPLLTFVMALAAYRYIERPFLIQPTAKGETR